MEWTQSSPRSTWWPSLRQGIDRTWCCGSKDWRVEGPWSGPCRWGTCRATPPGPIIPTTSHWRRVGGSERPERESCQEFLSETYFGYNFPCHNGALSFALTGVEWWIWLCVKNKRAWWNTLLQNRCQNLGFTFCRGWKAVCLDFHVKKKSCVWKIE